MGSLFSSAKQPDAIIEPLPSYTPAQPRRVYTTDYDYSYTRPSNFYTENSRRASVSNYTQPQRTTTDYDYLYTRPANFYTENAQRASVSNYTQPQRTTTDYNYLYTRPANFYTENAQRASVSTQYNNCSYDNQVGLIKNDQVLPAIQTKSTIPVRNYVLNHTDTINWSPMDDREVQLVPINIHSSECSQICNKFMKSIRGYEIFSIERIQNIYLYGGYLIKKEELISKYGQCREEILFHGTTIENAFSICSNNFDWRKTGQNIGHRFGQGVSFSPSPYYATHYCDKASQNKLMFAVKVLISNSCRGNSNMILPPDGYDTTYKPGKKDVVVKYYDDEFYPAYAIGFTRKNNRNKQD